MKIKKKASSKIVIYKIDFIGLFKIKKLNLFTCILKHK